LPPLTQFVMGISDFIQANALALGLGTAGLILGIVFALRVPAIRDRWHGVALRLPVVGRLLRLSAAAQYLRTLALVIFALVGGIQFMNGNVIDPMLMGRALRLSSFGIIISLAFWAAVWGIPGMFLSVPIMVALMIVCSHVPGLRRVAILLSREGLPETAQDLEPRGPDTRDQSAA
ncbi:MAG: AI-2E family transporter, partial [Roseovarius sp.]|nr:AI-2E family transporter [Roseovarius sp.]